MLSGKLKFLVPVLVIALLATSLLWTFRARPAFAHITLEVNPNLTLTVDSRSRVLAVELGEGQAQELFADTDFRHMPLEAALRQIAAKIEAAGLLTPERRVLLTAHAATGTAPELTGEGITAKNFRKEIRDIAESLLDMREEGISEAIALQVLQKAIKADPALREVTTIVYDFLDLVEAGFAPETALAATSRAIAADPTLREHSTIVAVLADLKEEGLSDSEALAKLELAITADPTLRSLDDLVEKGLPGTRGRALGRNKDKDRADEDKDDEDDDENKDDDEDSGRQKGRGLDDDRDDNDKDDKDEDSDDDDNSKPEFPGKGQARGR
jgi:hypothetical protein